MWYTSLQVFKNIDRVSELRIHSFFMDTKYLESETYLRAALIEYLSSKYGYVKVSIRYNLESIDIWYVSDTNMPPSSKHLCFLVDNSCFKHMSSTSWTRHASDNIVMQRYNFNFIYKRNICTRKKRESFIIQKTT